MEPGNQTAATLLGSKCHLLPEALLTRTLQGQALTDQPAVLLGPPCIEDKIISFLLLILRQFYVRYMIQCYFYF